jgi:uncharacterized protein
METVSGVDDIHESLEILLATSQGERVMLDRFGCNLDGFLFEEVNRDLINTLTSMVSDAILYYEPRITLDTVEVFESETETGVLSIRIDYTVNSTNSRFSMVYPFYINEAMPNR